MIIFGYDTETTGLPDWKSPSDSPEQPHLVQIAGLLVDTETHKTIASLDLIIKPEGWTIPEEVTEVHGITNEYASKYGVPEKAAFELFIALWNGHRRVAHNRTFDQRIMRIAAKRYGTEEQIEAWAEKDNHDCTMLMAKPIMQLLPKGRYGFKNPKLSEAYSHFTGKELVDAHTALADAQACVDIYLEMLGQQEEAA